MKLHFDNRPILTKQLFVSRMTPDIFSLYWQGDCLKPHSHCRCQNQTYWHALISYIFVTFRQYFWSDLSKTKYVEVQTLIQSSNLAFGILPFSHLAFWSYRCSGFKVWAYGLWALTGSQPVSYAVLLLYTWTLCIRDKNLSRCRPTLPHHFSRIWSVIVQ